MRTRTVVTASMLVVAHFFIHVGFGIGAGAPDLLTLALLLLARESHMAGAALVGLAMGLTEDAQGLLAFGASGFAMASVGALASWTRDYFVGETRLFAVAYLFLGKWVRDFLYWLAVGSDARPGAFGALVVDAGLAALYMTVVGLAVTFLLGDLRNSEDVR